MQVGLPFSFADVAAARDRIATAIVRTPSAVSHTLSSITGAEVVVKFENLQFTSDLLVGTVD
jgi:threonine dehydratase